jgi:hypothetical protein
MNQVNSSSVNQLPLFGLGQAVKPMAYRSRRRTGCRKGRTPVRQLAGEVAPDCTVLDTRDLKDPRESWMAVEDVLLRLSKICCVTVTQHDRHYELVFANFNDLDRRVCDQELLESVLDFNFYRWQCNGQGGNLVRLIHGSGADLVVQLADLKTIARWMDGEELVWQVQSFLLQLQRWGAVMVAEV